MRPYLLPAAWAYGGVMAVRNALFDAGVFGAADVGIPVISIGNISAGGTGKTPLVESVAASLSDEGYKTGVLSRGYGRDTTGFRWVRNGTQIDSSAAACGDEPVQVARNVPDAFVAVDEDRVEGARTMIAEAGIEVLVLDDAFQHRWIARTMDVVVLTAREVIDGDELLPAGRRREPFGSTRRAAALVVTGCADDAVAEKVRGMLRVRTDREVFCTYATIPDVREIATGKRIEAKRLSGKRVLAVSGIGNPASFRESLRRAGLTIGAERSFPDHYMLTAADVSDLRLLVKQDACDAIVMTQKDAVRMAGTDVLAGFSRLPVYHTTMQLEWIGGRGAFDRLVLRAVEGRRGQH